MWLERGWGVHQCRQSHHDDHSCSCGCTYSHCHSRNHSYSHSHTIVGVRGYKRMLVVAVMLVVVAAPVLLDKRLPHLPPGGCGCGCGCVLRLRLRLRPPWARGFNPLPVFLRIPGQEAHHHHPPLPPSCSWSVWRNLACFDAPYSTRTQSGHAALRHGDISLTHLIVATATSIAISVDIQTDVRPLPSHCYPSTIGSW